MYFLSPLKNLYVFLAVVVALAVSTTAVSDNADKIQQVRAELFKNLANAATQPDGRAAEHQVWQFWFSLSPTAEIRHSLDEGIERREVYDYEAAENHFNAVVMAAPEYSEGYNQRAFIRFLRENYVESQADLEKTLELEPDHFGAITGLYHILRIQNRHQAAMSMLQKAVTIHPWIQERGALPRDLWPDGYRDIHDPELKI